MLCICTKRIATLPISKLVYSFLPEKSHKGQPFLWVFGDHIHDCLPGDASVHHLGHNVLQKVGVPMPSIAGLQMGTATGIWIV